MGFHVSRGLSGHGTVPFAREASIRAWRWSNTMSAFALLVAAVTFTACGERLGTPVDTIVVGQVAEPRSLDPHVATTTNDFRILAHVYEGLVRFKPGTLDLGPSLARDWHVDDTGTRYTFHLREDVAFHDGSRFDADAVRFNFERMLVDEHPFAETGPFPMAFLFSMIESIDTPDRFTVVFSLNEPFSPFLSNLAYPTGYMVSPAKVRSEGRRFGRAPSGTGPWRFVDWARQRWVTLERFAEHRDAADGTAVRRLIFRPLPDENARLTELLSGGVDLLVEAPPDLVGYLRDHEAFGVVETVGSHLWFLILNTRAPPFDDVRMRRAVNYAVDKEAIARDLLQGTASVAHSVVSRAFAWATNHDVEPYPYDPDKARELIEEAGQTGATLRLHATESGSGMLEPLPMAGAIQADLARVGLDVRIEVFEWNTFLARVNAGLEGRAEMAQMAWITHDPDTLPSLALSSDALPEAGGFNSGYFENPRLDELLRAARRTADFDARDRKSVV